MTALWVELKWAQGIKNKLGYLLMPPGWFHTGDHKTVTAQRARYAAGVAINRVN